MAKRPVMIEIDDEEPVLTPDEAPEVSEPEGRAMQAAMGVLARPPSLFGRLFRWALGGVVTLALSVWAWDFAVGLMNRHAVLGYVATGLIAAMTLAALFVILRELFALRRLRRLDRIRQMGARALADNDLTAAKRLGEILTGLYANRPDMEWHIARFNDVKGGVMDADAYLALIETHLLAPLDQAATAQVEAAARQVALVTAFIPLTFADMLVALSANLRMIRQVSLIYGGRGGALGNWRLARNVLAHLLATGAMSVGEDLLEPIIGGGLMSKLSRRFGEGVVNGALTARVGAATMEVSRPLDFTATPRPPVRKIVRRSLTGIFDKGQQNEA